MLEFSWPSFAFAVVNFLVLAALLYRFLHKPLLELIHKRHERLGEARRSAQEETDKARQAREAYEAKLAAAGEERDKLLAEARASGEESKQKLIDQATAQAREEAERLQQACERERRDTLDRLRDEVADSAVAIAGSVLSRAADRDLDAQLTRSLIEALDAAAQGGAGPSAGDASQPVAVIGAREIAGEDRDRITERIKAASGPDTKIEFRVDASLLAGARVEFPTRVVDSSLAHILSRIRSQAKASAVEDGKEDAGEGA